MLKKVPIMPVRHGKKFTVGDGARLVRMLLLYASRVWQSSVLLHGSCASPQGGLAASLRFRARSEGLGKHAQWWNDSTVEFLAGLLEIVWLASGAVDSIY